MSYRRTFGSLLVATALVLAPAAAHAYEDDDDVLLVGDANPAVGQSFPVRVNAGPGSNKATLTVTSTSEGIGNDDIEIAGTQSMTKATDAAGVARFSVTLYAEGRYAMVGYDQAGNVVGRSLVVVGDGVLGSGNGGDDTVGGLGESANNGLSLPLTGMDGTTALLGGVGVLLLAGGGAVMLVSRRRAT